MCCGIQKRSKLLLKVSEGSAAFSDDVGFSAEI